MKTGLVVVLLAFLAHKGHAQKVNATGGGIVKPGADLVLTYTPKLEAGANWDRCQWFWKEADGVDVSCSFDLIVEEVAAGEVVAKKHRCSSEDGAIAKAMTFTGKNKAQCEVTVANVTEAANGTWATRLDYEAMNHNIDVIVATPVKKGEIVAGTVQDRDTFKPNTVRAGQNNTVVCSFHGGRPAPAVAFTLDNITPIYTAEDQTVNKEGEYETKYNVVIKPEPKDHGKTVTCRAAQFDKMNARLYEDAVDAQPIKLNVVFPAGAMAKQEAHIAEGHNATVSFVFEANPAPENEDVKWVITKPMRSYRDVENASTKMQEIVLTPGHDDDKYLAKNIIKESEIKYRLNLTMWNVQPEDANNTFVLMVNNTVGTTNFTFALKVEPKDYVPNPTTTTVAPGTNNTTEKPAEQMGSSSSAVFIILVLLIIAVVVAGSAYLYMKKRNQRNETAPFTSTSNLVNS